MNTLWERMTHSSWQRGPEGTGQAGDRWPCAPERCKGLRKKGRQIPRAHHVGPSMQAKSALGTAEAKAGEPQVRAAGSAGGAQRWAKQVMTLCAPLAPHGGLTFPVPSFTQAPISQEGLKCSKIKLDLDSKAGSQLQGQPVHGTGH